MKFYLFEKNGHLLKNPECGLIHSGTFPVGIVRNIDQAFFDRMHQPAETGQFEYFSYTLEFSETICKFNQVTCAS